MVQQASWCARQGKLDAPAVEAVSRGELTEAAFRHLARAHRGQPRPGPYYAEYLNWLKQGLPPAQAYVERSAVHALAKCYLQACCCCGSALACNTAVSGFLESEATEVCSGC